MNERDELVMMLLVQGFTVAEVSVAADLYEYHVRRIKSRMCKRAEMHGKLALLKLWAGDLRRVA